MEFEKVVKERMSTRKFQDKRVPEETLKKILEIGRLAPTAKNLQPQKIYVIQSEEGLLKIDKSSRCRFNAPTVLLVCSDKNIAWKKDEYSTYEMDASIVATHLMLAATNYHVDNIWIKLFDKNIIKKEFHLEENIEPICLIPLGYKTDDYKASPLHTDRKPITETVEFL